MKIQGDNEIYSWLLNLTFSIMYSGNNESYEFLAASYDLTDKDGILFFVKVVEFDQIYHGFLNVKLIDVMHIPYGEFAKVINSVWSGWGLE